MAQGGSKIVFLGTGSSAGTPMISCVLQQKTNCVCKEASENPSSVNNRGNPSLLIILKQPNSQDKCIMIDAGKSFRSSVIKWFPQYGVQGLHSLILTHDHADAILGMDDLREVQTVFCGETGTNSDICVPINVYADTRTMTSVNRTYPYLMGNVSRAGKVPTFVREQEKEEAVGKEGEEKGEEKECNQVEKDSNNENEKGSGVNDISTENSSEPTKSEETNVEGVKEKIEEIVEENGSVESSIFWTDPSCQLETEEESEMAEKGKVSERATTIYRWVAKFNWFTFDENPFYSFYVEGLRFTPLPVLHGDDYISYGFSFGEKQRVVYISDVSAIPPPTSNMLMKWSRNGNRIHILILDMLKKDETHLTHFNQESAIQVAKLLRPENVYFVGMSHGIDHHSTNNELQSRFDLLELGIHVQLAYDGLALDVEF